jgi:hypothetical protein
MKNLISILVLVLSFSNCKSQNIKPINSLFIDKFIDDNKNSNLFHKDTLYIYGRGVNYKSYNIYVKFLEFNDIKNKVENQGNFNLIEISEVFVKKDILMIEFSFLIALKDENVDFATSHDTNLTYCMKLNSNTKEFSVVDCEFKE